MSKFRNSNYKNVWQYDDGLYICQIGDWDFAQYYLITKENSKRWSFDRLRESEYLEITNLTRVDGIDYPKGWKSRYFTDQSYKKSYSGRGYWTSGTEDTLRGCVSEILDRVQYYLESTEWTLKRLSKDLRECQESFF